MGAFTPDRSAEKMPAGRVSNLFLRLRRIALSLALASLFSSAKSQAGLVELPASPAPVLHDPTSAALDSADATPTVNPTPDELSLEQQFLAADKAAPVRGWKFVDPTAPVRNATPSSHNSPPLLIPLPTGVSTGAIGLVALVLIFAPQRLRKRLLR